MPPSAAARAMTETVFKFKVGPVLTVKSMDPLPDDRTVENKVTPLIFDFGIGETAP